MKLGLGNLWRRASRSLGLENEAPKERIQDPVAPPGVIGWLNEDATAGLVASEAIEWSDSEVVVRIQQPVDSGRKVWLVPPTADGVSGTVRSCDEIAEGFRVSVLLDRAEAIAESEQARLGRVSLAWTAANGSICRASVAIESGTEGELEISTPETVPVPALVLLSSYEYRGLGVAKQCRREKDSYRLTVGMTEEVYPQPHPA